MTAAHAKTKGKATVSFEGSTVTANQIENPCILITASYNGGRFVDVQMKDIKENTSATLTDLNLNFKNANRVSAMLWSGKESIRPLCNPANMDL